MAAKTVNNYISETMKDTIDFSTANLRFMTTESSKKLSASGCSSSRQPEISIWPKNRKYLYIGLSVEPWHRPRKFQRQIWGLRPRWARKNCPGRLRQQQTTGSGNIYVLGANLATFGRRLCRNNLATLLSRSLRSKMPDLPLEFRDNLS